MTTASMAQAANARCLRCRREYYDTTGSTACPGCGEMVEIESIGKLAPKPQAAPASQAPAPAVSTRPALVIGLFAFLFGAPAWLEGARTTRDGWVFALNWVLDRVGLPFQIPLASSWHWAASIGVMVALGWAYSRVELRWGPVRPPRNLRRDFFRAGAWQINRSATVWLIWILVLFTDVVTMFLGARQAGAGDPVFLQQIAASVTAAWIYAILITFVPDRLMRYGWRSLRG